jgi:16S rRNA (guanine1207-N2)-methyltransferase
MHLEGQGGQHDGGDVTAHAADPATEVMLGLLDRLEPGARPLVVEEASGALVAALAAQGCAAQVWLRNVGVGGEVRAWPPAGPFSAALVRLPKAKDSLEFALHAAASVTARGAPIYLFGANDEGIRSAASRLEAVTDGVQTLDTRRHCRVLMGVRRERIAGLKARLSDWRAVGEIEIGGVRRLWVSYPGLFAGGRLDDGTAMLLAYLPEVRAGARVLDFGCGTGVIGAAVLARQPQTVVDLVDADTLAIEAVRENVPAGRAIVGDRLAAVGQDRYDAIVSNPPLHAGVAEDHGAMQRFIREAPSCLKAGGVLQLVVQRRVKASELMREAFGNVDVVAEDGRFRVLRSVRR